MQTSNPRAFWIALISSLVLAPSLANAVPVTYDFTGGSATLRASLEGTSTSIFEGSSVISVGLADASATYDSALAAGQLIDLSMTAEDFSIDLNESLVALDSISVLGAEVNSTGAADVNIFGQFAVQTEITADVAGLFPDGSPFGPVAVVSLPSSGTTTGLLSVSGDTLMLQIVGVTLASFEQLADPGAPDIELKADFTFVAQRRPTSPIPEPTSALLFAAGFLVAGQASRKRRRS